jgi:nucleoid DNA-binding protein
VKKINSHIAYLLTKHECVVIPGFGAFVTSFIPASGKEREGEFSPPSQLLGFNPEIKHNDGLLTHFLSVIQKISYKEADLLIKQYVNQLNDLLYTDKTVNIEWIGRFSLSTENKIIFTPDSHLSCNAIHFGFNHFSLPQLKDLKFIEPITVEPEKDEEVITISVNRRTLAWAASVAAAILALFLISTPLNNHEGQHTQNASFFPAFRNIESSKAIVPDTLEILPVPAIVDEPAPVSRVSSSYYYVIVASLSSEEKAQIALSAFQKAGFPQAAIVSKEGRYRVYINRLETKEEAISYLRTFRTDNPKYANAWLLKQSNG